MSRPKHIIKSLDNSSVRLINENFRSALDELELANFKGGEINTGTVQITQNIVQAPVITMEGSEVNGEHITPASITTDQIAANTITADNIAAGTITTTELASDYIEVGGAAGDVNSGLTTIDGGKITANSVTADQIAAGTITTGELAFTPVASDNVIATINASTEGITIDADKVTIEGDFVVTGGAADDINAGETTISGSKITTGSISTGQIAAGSITSDKINVLSLDAITANLGEATSGSLVVGGTNKLWLNDSNDGALAIGGTNKATAPFRVDAAGNVLMESATLTGNVYALGGELAGITDANIDVGPYGNIRGGQTDFNTGEGFFIGNSGGDYKLSVGNTNNSLTWDGSALRIAGNVALTSPLEQYGYTAATLPTPPSYEGANNPGGID